VQPADASRTRHRRCSVPGAGAPPPWLITQRSAAERCVGGLHPPYEGLVSGLRSLVRYVKEVGPGWFIGCNIANREKKKILRAACDVMGLAFGRDLKIDLVHA
jgi:hypothetical protein